MWLVDSQFGIVGNLLNFHMWTGVKIFRPESGVKFFIHEFFHTWNRCEFSIRHAQPCSTCEILNLHTFQTCFWCESGMKQAWSYENILYGVRHDGIHDILRETWRFAFPPRDVSKTIIFLYLSYRLYEVKKAEISLCDEKQPSIHPY